MGWECCEIIVTYNEVGIQAPRCTTITSENVASELYILSYFIQHALPVGFKLLSSKVIQLRRILK
jgi:hypothetical protein